MATLKERLRSRKGLSVALGLVLVLGTALGYLYAGPLGPGARAGAAQMSGEPTHSGTLRNPKFTPSLTAKHAPVYTAEQAKALHDRQDAALKQLPGVKLASTPTVHEAHPGPALPNPPVKPVGAQPRFANGDFHVENSVTLPAGAICVTDCVTSSAAEESVAADGKDIFVTGNYYAATSADNGASWFGLDPYVFDPYFCCYQQVMYEPSRDFFLWLLPTWNGYGNVNNHLTLVSTPGVLGSVCTWTIQPTDVGLPSGTFMGNPQISYGTDYAYVSFVAYNASGVWVEANIVRLDLNVLASINSGSCYPTLTYNWYASAVVHAYTLADGATDTMYFAGSWYEDGSGFTGNHLRLFFWKEATNTINVGNFAIDPYIPLATGAGNCASQDAVVTNWCYFANSTIGAGYRSRAGYKGKGSPLLAFAFNAQANGGSGLPWPYVVREYFNLYNVTYTGHENVYNTDVAILYPSMAVTAARGYVGGEFIWGGGTGSNHFYPGDALFYENPTNLGPAGSLCYCLYGGGNGIFDAYTVSRSVSPAADQIISGEWIMNGSASQPWVVEFGEARDTNAYLRWENA